MKQATLSAFTFNGLGMVIAIILVALSLPTASLHAAEWAWKLQQDEQLTLRLQQKTDTVTAVEKKLIRVSLEVNTELKWRVIAVDNGKYSIEQTVDSMLIKMLLPDRDGTLEYDSKSTARPRGVVRQLARGVAPLLESKVTFRMDSLGKVSDVESNLEDELGDGGQSESLRGLFTADVMNEMLAQIFPPLPAQPADSTESEPQPLEWSSTATRRLAIGEVKVQTKYSTMPAQGQGSDEDEQKASTTTKIGVTGKVELAAQSDQQQETLRIDSGELTGSLQFDHAAGRFRSGDITQVVVAESRSRTRPIRTRVTSRVTFSVE